MRVCCLCKKKVQRDNGPFFRIPSDEWRRNKWSEVCRRQFGSQSLICSDHFLPTDIRKGAKKSNLMPSAMPFVAVVHEDPIADSRASASSKNTSNVHPEDFSDISMGSSLDDPVTTVEHKAGERSKIISKTEESLDVPVTTVGHKAGQRSKNTSNMDIEFNMSMENGEYEEMIEKLQAKNKNLQEENETLERKLTRTKAAITFMGSIFTEGQMKKIMTPGKAQWNRNDIANAIRLHAAGPKTYNYMYKRGYPLPQAAILEHWCRKLNINNGFLKTSLGFIRHCTELTNEDKICTLAFGEMEIEESAKNNSLGDSDKKQAGCVQVVTARGLWKSWERPVFFDFEYQMKKDVLFSIISKLNQAGFQVLAMVCDISPTNRKLFEDLGVNTDRPWFPNPINPYEKVFTFVDAPHLLELIRYHFLDTGMICNNELLTSGTIAEVLKNTSASDNSITCKITDEHLSVKGEGGLKLAAQLFSSTTANAIRECNTKGMNINKPMETANFIQLVNDWFDVLNSTTNTFSTPGKEPFGITLADQRTILLRMNELMSSPIVPNKTSLEYFQEGVIITNTALQMLYDYARQKLNMMYILTSRLNQDMLRYVFWAIRSKGSKEEHPTRTEFKHRLRKYIVARNMEYFHGTDNVESSATDWHSSTNSMAMIKSFDKHKVRNKVETDHEHEVLHEIVADCDSEVLDKLDTTDFDDENMLQEGALADYIVGYAVSD